MIAYVDKPPTIEAHDGLFVLTAKSGDEAVQIALTPHALTGMLRAGARASDEFFEATLSFEVTPIRRRGPGRTE
jgi:hypothetical protein